MMKKNLTRHIIICIMLSIAFIGVYAQNTSVDTLQTETLKNEKQEQFYDSLKVKAGERKVTQWIYDLLVNSPHPIVDEKELSINYYAKMQGKVISEIHIKSLDVFGPTIEDTTRRASNWIEKTANTIHTKSNLKTIERMLLFKSGDKIDPELLYENERIIRSLPYIREISFILIQDSIYEGLVDVYVITKDRFSFGATGYIKGVETAALEFFNQNVFGIGHEIGVRFVGHVKKQPYLGFETYYKINNIKGSFLDASVSYLNTYKNSGLELLINKRFFTPSVKWGYGATFLRIYKSDRIFEDDPVVTQEPLNLVYYGAWGGRSFQLNNYQQKNSQLVFSLGANVKHFFERPIVETTDNFYFANNTFLLAGITLTQRNYNKDKLVYSYGITEDIPEGFKHEFVFGYDFNEFGNRHYAHLLLSNGNFLKNRPGYLYFSGDIGGYFNSSTFEQGQLNAEMYFISRQINAGKKRFRLFIRTDYSQGINRFEPERLTLNRDRSIRGFSSNEVFGQQRLRLNLEYVLFLKREFYKFNIALFGFGDVGVIGSRNQFILSQQYYSGLGAGIRLHNENLVLKTLQLRLAFYPFHPKDVQLVGFILEEQLKRQFYSFEPQQPMPIAFE